MPTFAKIRLRCALTVLRLMHAVAAISRLQAACDELDDLPLARREHRQGRGRDRRMLVEERDHRAVLPECGRPDRERPVACADHGGGDPPATGGEEVAVDAQTAAHRGGVRPAEQRVARAVRIEDGAVEVVREQWARTLSSRSSANVLRRSSSATRNARRYATETWRDTNARRSTSARRNGAAPSGAATFSVPPSRPSTTSGACARWWMSP